jgi:CO dehydrogenase/acetyl-CoA synthase gamma subunit (corrinoid Fe-S protein)
MFTQDETKISNRYTNRYSTSLIIRKVKIITIMTLLFVRIAIIKDTRNKCWYREEEAHIMLVEM